MELGQVGGNTDSISTDISSPDAHSYVNVINIEAKAIEKGQKKNLFAINVSYSIRDEAFR